MPYYPQSLLSNDGDNDDNLMTQTGKVNNYWANKKIVMVLKQILVNEHVIICFIHLDSMHSNVLIPF